MKKVKTIDDYISAFPQETQLVLRKIKDLIKKEAPKAEERLTYGIPTFFLNGNLVHFGGFKSHIGFYPTPAGIEKFKDELAKYKGAKGSVQFQLDQEIPYDLIRRIVLFRIEQNTAEQNR